MDARQTARMLVGIARTQAVILQSLARNDPRVMPTVVGGLQGFVGIGAGRSAPVPVSWENLPARVLLRLVAGLETGELAKTEKWAEEEVSRLAG